MEPTIYVGVPFRLDKYMPMARFEGILWSLRYTHQKDIEYYDGFFYMRKMEESWNLNMAEEFNPSWINVLGGRIMDWFNKYAPGFMCGRCKPHNLVMKGTLFVVV